MTRIGQTERMNNVRETAGEDVAAGVRQPLLEEPSTNQNPMSISSLLVFVERQKLEQGKAADKRADAAEIAEDHAQQVVIEAMRREAEHSFQKGVVSGLATLGSGIVEVSGAGLSIAGNKKAAAVVTSTKDVVNGSGSLLAVIPDSAAKQDATAKEQAENDAKFAQRRAQRETEFAKSSNDVAQQTLQRLESMLQAHQQSMSAMLQRA